MSGIISSKNGRLHIYVRQDKYKGKLKSENWVGRTYHNGKQKVISSGTPNLEEAKVILEKWYDDLTSEKIQENTEPQQDIASSKSVEKSSNEETSRAEFQKKEGIDIKKEENFISQRRSVAPEKKKKLNLDLSFFKKIFSKKPNVNKIKKPNESKKKDSLLKLKNLFNEKISKSNIANEEIAGIDISENSIKVAQLSKKHRQ